MRCEKQEQKLNNIILCGYKAAGKTTLGRKIAEKTGRHFVDTDDLISKNNRKFYLEVGLEAFREIEKQVIAALHEFQNSVIATGGGAVLDPSNVIVLKKLGPLIYLRVPKEELKRRLLALDPLPGILDPADPEGSFEKMHQARVGLYESVADHIVDSEEQLWAIL
jgi:shikimate kinase